MKKLLHAFCFLLISFFPLTIFSQTCGTINAPHASLLKEYSSVSRSGGPYIIPVVFHIYYDSLYNTFLPTYLDVQHELDNLNERIHALNADTAYVSSLYKPLIAAFNVEFRLATLDENGNCTSGIFYHYTNNTFIDGNYTVLDPYRYLNIHFNASMFFGMSPASAWASFPQPYSVGQSDGDGIFVLFPEYLINTPYLMAHEAGHWMGLAHTFGFANEVGPVCGDDFVADTPPTAGSPGNCDTLLQYCTPGVIENVQNTMDYSNCNLMFTQGQVARVHGVFEDTTLNRRDIWKPLNLALTGVDPVASCGFDVDFITIANTLQPNCPYFTNVRAVVNPKIGIPDSVQWSVPGGSPSSFSTPYISTNYATSGTYTITMTAYKNGTPYVVTHSFNVQTPPLAEISAYPYVENFENSFSLPSSHIDVVNSTSTWTEFNTAGLNSTHCVYVPQETGTAADTNILRIGSFRIDSLDHPFLSFWVATSRNAQSIDRKLRVRGTNMCDGTSYTLDIQYDSSLAMNNTANPFVPNSPSQWVPVRVGLGFLKAKAIYDKIEISLELIKDFSSGTQDANFFVDNINVDDSLSMLPPVADFSMDQTFYCQVNTCYNFEFADRTTGGIPNFWNWSWPAAPYNLVGPVVEGCFYTYGGDSIPIRMIAVNDYGRDTVIKYIHLGYPEDFQVSASDSTLCAGDTIVLAAYPDSVGTFTWAFGYPDGPNTTSLLQTSGDTVQAVGQFTYGYYYATATDSQGCKRSEYVMVETDPLPYANYWGQTCIDTADTISLSVGALSNYSYVWSPSYGLSSTTDPVVQASPDTTTAYTVVVSEAGNQCTSSVNITLHVTNPVPQISLTGDSLVCQGQQVWLYANAGAQYYYWSGSNGVAVNHQDSALAILNGNSSTFYVYAIDSNGCQTTTDSIHIQVQPLPQFWVAPFNTGYQNAFMVNLCGPGDSTLVLTADANNPYSYTFTPAGNFTSLANGSAKFHGMVSGMYPVSVIATDSLGCSTTKPFLINKTSNTPVNFTVNPNPPSVCFGDTLSISLNPSTLYYYWSPQDSVFGTPSSPTSSTNTGMGNTAKVSPYQNTLYQITALNSSTGCATTRPYNVQVYHPQVSTSITTAQICAGDSISIQLSGVGAYNWSPVTNLALTGGGVNAVAFPGSSTIYTATATVGNCTATASVDIQVNPNPMLTVNTTADEICAGDTATIFVSANSIPQWSPMQDITVGPGGMSAFVYPSTTTSYIVSVADTSGCISEEQVSITVNPSPANPVIQINGNTLISSVGDTYQWYLDGMPIPGATAQQYTMTQNGVYTVMITNTWGCSAVSDPITIIDLGVESSNNSPVLIFPNPSSGIVNIHGASGDFILYNELGQIIEHRATPSEKFSIDLSALRSGVYTIQMNDLSGIVVRRKLVIAR